MAQQSNNNQQAKASVLSTWGNGMLNKLSALARNSRKRLASKKRRQLACKELENERGG